MEIAEIENRIVDRKLAVDGGKPVRSHPMPGRKALGPGEIAMLEERWLELHGQIDAIGAAG